MKFLFKGYLVNYEVIENDKDTSVLFLHGWGGNLHSFDLLKKYLLSCYNLISISMPPYFLEDIDSLNPLNMDDYLDLVRNILILSNKKKLILICHSFGFRIALMLLSLNFKIEKIVVTGGAGISLDKNIFQTINFNQKLLINKLKHFEVKRKVKTDYSILKGVDRISFKNIVNKNLKEYVKLIDCPTLLFWGKKDKSTPLKIYKYLKKNIRNNIAVLTHSDHFCYIKENNKFINSILKFLNS